jgi:diguanylate cyclase (GGDEF)-like protein/PAS domain S-box-containing protein
LSSIPCYAVPDDESDRLASLQAYQILDTGPDKRFDTLTQLATKIFDVPIALVSLIDADRQWFKSSVGFIPAGSETDRNVAFCTHAISSPERRLIVEDATKDSRFLCNPVVTGPPGIRFYAGAAVLSDKGHALGTLCILDTRPRKFSATDIDILNGLAASVSSALELHRSIMMLRESEEHHRQTIALSPQTLWTADAQGRIIEVGPRWVCTTGMTREQAVGKGWSKALHPDDVAPAIRLWEHALLSGEPVDTEYRLRNKTGAYRWFRSYGAPRRSQDGKIIRWYGTVEDIHERKLSQASVERLAYHDSLTGLPNRVRFHDRLEQAIASVARGGSFALLCLDLDNFKAVNDALGHPSGDVLLRRVADRLSAAVREADVVARIGGDEFLMLVMGQANPADTAALAERILASLAIPVKVNSHLLAVDASIGIAMCPRDGVHPDKLMQSADLALYRAKAAGRQTYRFFEAEMDERMRQHQAMKIELRTALDRNELDLAYQPLVGLQSGRVEGFEALLRWNHPERGTVSPTDFISAAEVTGLIVPMGRWALLRACCEAKLWPDNVRVAVNLSPVQFGQRDLPLAVSDALSASGLAPERLELEITESVPLLTNEANLSVLHDLREIGVSIALDDFGTGYSSLGYLHRFPFSKIKIDRSFVSRISEAQDARTLVKTIIAMARALGISVTAEGVETQAQADFLHAQGCGQVQGYLFSRPVRARDVPSLIDGIRSRLAGGRPAAPLQSY